MVLIQNKKNHSKLVLRILTQHRCRERQESKKQQKYIVQSYQAARGMSELMKKLVMRHPENRREHEAQ